MANTKHQEDHAHHENGHHHGHESGGAVPHKLEVRDPVCEFKSKGNPK